MANSTNKLWTNAATIPYNRRLMMRLPHENCVSLMKMKKGRPSPQEEDMNNDVDISPVPMDLSNPRTKTKLINNPTPDTNKSPLLPSWQMCELCDNKFPSKKILMEHLWKVHKAQRLHVQAGIPPIPDIEITPLIPIAAPARKIVSPPSPALVGAGGRSLADEIIYHPPASMRRRTSNSSSSGSGGSSNYSRASCSTDHESDELEANTVVEACRICFEQFEDKGMLQNHLKLCHPSDNRFHCDLCDKELSSRAALQGHLRIHTGEKPHNCKICNRAFSNSQTLSRHMRTHTGEKPYECPICGKRASLRHNMKLHIKIHEKQMLVGQNG